MAESIRFHLDENVDRVIASGLRRRAIDVTTTKDAGLLGATDAQQLDYARREGRVIFTQDTDFLVIASKTVEHAGIVYARKGTRTNRQLIESLELIHRVLDSDDMLGHVEFV
jgi:predicted nuclease of predicted toxin-antitoxin system